MATDQTFIIRGTLKNAAGTALASATVKATRLQSPAVAASLVDSTQYSADSFSATTNSSGVYSITVTHALAATCPLTYRVDLPDKRYYLVHVGLNDGSREFDAGVLLCETSPAGPLATINITSLVEKNMREGGAVAYATSPVATARVSDAVVGDYHSTTITMASLPVTVGNTTGVSFGGTKILDFPAGQIYILGAYQKNVTFDLTSASNLTPIDSADGGDISVGTTAPTDGTLAGTDVDICPSASIDPISGGAATSRLAAAATFDGTATAVDAFFNILIDDADVADGASDVILVNGTVVINWVFGGDD